MQKKFLCAFAIFAIVAAMTFSEADACRRCNYDGCSGCEQTSYISVPSHPIVLPSLPSHSYPLCHGCSAPCEGPSHYPRQYCGGCLRRKTHRLVKNCGCGCGC